MVAAEVVKVIGRTGIYGEVIQVMCKILEILEKKYRAAYEGCDAKEMENVLYLIRVVKKRIDGEIGRNIIEGKCSEDIISLNNQIGKIKHNLYKI